MDADTQEPDNGWKIGLAAFGLFVFIGVVSGLPPEIAIPVFGGTAACTALALTIIGVVHCVNFRDDPRLAKRPPDDP